MSSDPTLQLSCSLHLLLGLSSFTTGRDSRLPSQRLSNVRSPHVFRHTHFGLAAKDAERMVTASGDFCKKRGEIGEHHPNHLGLSEEKRPELDGNSCACDCVNLMIGSTPHLRTCLTAPNRTEAVSSVLTPMKRRFVQGVHRYIRAPLTGEGWRRHLGTIGGRLGFSEARCSHSSPWSSSCS